MPTFTFEETEILCISNGETREEHIFFLERMKVHLPDRMSNSIFFSKSKIQLADKSKITQPKTRIRQSSIGFTLIKHLLIVNTQTSEVSYLLKKRFSVA